MNTVKSQILDQLANNYPKFLKSDLKKCLNLILNEITDSLAKNQNIEIRDFGTFKIKKTKSRIGRNPKTKEDVMIAPRNVISFVPSRHILNKLNESMNEK